MQALGGSTHTCSRPVSRSAPCARPAVQQAVRSVQKHGRRGIPCAAKLDDAPLFQSSTSSLLGGSTADILKQQSSQAAGNLDSVPLESDVSLNRAPLHSACTKLYLLERSISDAALARNGCTKRLIVSRHLRAAAIAPVLHGNGTTRKRLLREITRHCILRLCHACLSKQVLFGCHCSIAPFCILHAICGRCTVLVGLSFIAYAPFLYSCGVKGCHGSRCHGCTCTGTQAASSTGAPAL